MQDQPLKPIARRTFLATTAAGLAASATAQVATPKQAGLIGLGETGQALFSALHENPRAMRVRAIADTGTNRPGRFEGVRTTANWRLLVEDEKLDAVIIATPDHLHVSMAIAALKAGKSVYLVPPLAHTRADLTKLARAARQHPGQLYIARDRAAEAHWGRYARRIDEVPRWLQADIAVAAPDPSHWSLDIHQGLGHPTACLFSCLDSAMAAFNLQGPLLCSAFAGVFGPTPRSTPDTMTLAGCHDGTTRITLTARERTDAREAGPETTVRYDSGTVEIEAHPCTPDFDIVAWAQDPQNAAYHRNTDRTFAVQGAILDAGEGRWT